jgi:dipeptidyl aminopeptidase/acylaminoacyl peptidase
MEKVGKTVELYTYEGDNHNLSNNLSLALQRSVDFFDKYLKE